MTLTQLRAFVAVARLGSVKAAAISLGVSEPAVSGAVAVLRRELGDRLFVRAAGGIALTPGGRRLAAGAAEIVGLAEETRRQVRQAGADSSYLRVAATETTAEQITPPLLEAFVRRHPDVETTTLAVASTALGELLLDRRADVAISPVAAEPGTVAVGPAPDTLEHILFLRIQLVVVASPRHAGVRPDQGDGGRLHLPVGRLSREHWLLGPGGLDPGTPGGAFLTRHGVGDADASIFPSTSAALGAAVAGDGLSLAVLHLVRDELRRGTLTVVAVPGTPVNGVLRASALRGDRRSPTASALCRFVTTPTAVKSLMTRATGVPVDHYRPTVRVSLWS
ncbi:LysR family transcriptional regulator [Streptomyces sp. CB01881]|uniref:LysR family transcriptional regulator n=1 Tax=Streptomyces sp. CB01881 TaxID=2078691 RepID=UPI000CDCAEFC|nr:LysR family transcriptional regulator [Streptomyces sp. CB01881]AUY48282.1 LysR family transcriptional regulator [Streptomyces sp. CB01881]TYC76772.1 LysR family transcriptional regulator [Streptomyces sp. CB01881]